MSDDTRVRLALSVLHGLTTTLSAEALSVLDLNTGVKLRRDSDEWWVATDGSQRCVLSSTIKQVCVDVLVGVLCPIPPAKTFLLPE